MFDSVNFDIENDCVVVYCVYRDESKLLNSQCPKNLELRWQTEVSSSIYATPLIADINRYFVICWFQVVFYKLNWLDMIF